MRVRFGAFAESVTLAFPLQSLARLGWMTRSSFRPGYRGANWRLEGDQRMTTLNLAAEFAENSAVRPRTNYRLISELLAAIYESVNSDNDDRYPELETLCERLRSLDDDVRISLFEDTTSFLQTTLQSIIDGIRHRGGFSKENRRDLRSVVRILGCTLDRLIRSNSTATVDSEQLRLRYSEINLVELFWHVSASFEALAKKRSIDFRLRTPDVLWAEVDAEKIQIVLLNLLFNAFKYTPENSVISCWLDYQERYGELLIEVIDGGPGVPLNQLDAIFERSLQIDRSVFLRAGGFDFSLGTSRDLVLMHGGMLSVSRASSRGCAFRAVLPRCAPFAVPVSDHRYQKTTLAAQVAALAENELETEANLATEPITRDQRPLVLIVESNASIQRILRETLRPEFNTTLALNGLEGLQKAIEWLPDLILTGIVMPQMDGEVMMRAIRSRSELAAIPFLCLTGCKDPLQTVHLLEAGAQDVLHKPFLLSEVRARVAGLLAAKRTREILVHTTGREELDLVQLANNVAKQKGKLQVKLDEVRVQREVAESASRIKTNFLYIMSHELKTPVTAIQLHLRVLEHDPEVERSARLGDVLSRVSRSSQRLMQLINTCIEWARIETGRCRLVVEPFQIQLLVDQVMAELANYAKRKGIRFSTQIPATVKPLASDRRLVRLLLLNLIDFASQHSVGGKISVMVDEVDEHHRIWVADTSPPITEEQQHELFSPLQEKADVRWQAGIGSGLGLYVMQDIVRVIGGDFTLHSSQPSGNTYLLNLPSLVVPPKKAVRRPKIDRQAIHPETGPRIESVL